MSTEKKDDKTKYRKKNNTNNIIVCEIHSGRTITIDVSKRVIT